MLRRWLIQKLPEGFQNRYREWTRYAYLSNHECGLHTVLWGLLWVRVLYGVLQHVVLAEVPELLPTGARWACCSTNSAYPMPGHLRSIS